MGSFLNDVILIGCWKWTINQIDVIYKLSYMGPILQSVQRPPGMSVMFRKYIIIIIIIIIVKGNRNNKCNQRLKSII